MRNPTRERARAILGMKAKRPRIEAAGREATVYVYDYIGWMGVEAEPFVRAVAALDVDTIHVRINSPGGDVFEGRAIANALKNHKANVVCHVDGLAASIASIIAIAGDEVRMAEGSFLMIHNPWVFAIGDANDLRELADTLDKVGASLRDTYAARSGQDPDEVQAMMDDETWMSAEEAVEMGFADAAEGAASGASASYDLSVFDHAPEKLAAAAKGPQKASRPPTIRECETRLRDELGLSHTEARRAAAAVFRTTPDPRDEDDSGLAKLAAALEKRGAALATL
jgi:ATP-dependent Clp protease, protease subunit